MNKELLVALEHIEREKGIAKEILFVGIEAALVSAAKKILGKDQLDDVAVTIDRLTGGIQVFVSGQEIVSPQFGRIAAQTAKQVIIQKIREAERQVIFDEYTAKVGDLCTGSVHRFEKGDIIVDLGKTEAVVPKREQNPKERYKQGSRIRAYVLEVDKTPKGPQIILSRVHPNFVKRLFELEVPEIADGIVEIKAIAREPGERTKIAVFSKDSKVDAVGACVGMRGNRVKGIVTEMRGERIDIVRWVDDIRELVKNALNPAQVTGTKIFKEEKRVEVMVEEDQLSIAIGKHGQNVRTASQLIGWQIDIAGKTGAKQSGQLDPLAQAVAAADAAANAAGEGGPAAAVSAQKPALDAIEGVGPKTLKALEAAGYRSLDDLKGVTDEALLNVDGIGKKTAEKILAFLRSHE